MRTLVLNAGYEPLAVVSFRRALALVMNQKATIVEVDDEHPVWGIHSMYDRPSVIVLTRYVHIPRGRSVPVSRRGVLRRDAHRCAYCGVTATTVDHVMPRSRGGADSWENLVACCLRCNNIKSDHTPSEIGWRLRVTPRMPHDPGWAVRESSGWFRSGRDTSPVPRDEKDGGAGGDGAGGHAARGDGARGDGSDAGLGGGGGTGGAGTGARRLLELSLAQRRLAIVRACVRCLLLAAALLTVYFVVPVGEFDFSIGALVMLIVGVAVFAFAFAWQLRSIARSRVPGLRAVEALVTSILLFVIIFALVYLSVSANVPHSFSQPLDRVGALYFTIVTLGTVGYGDIAAVSAPARLLVATQVLMDLAFLAVIVRVITMTSRRSLTAGRSSKSSDENR